MQGKTHGAIGVATFAALTLVLPVKFSVGNLAVAVIGSLMPDIDHPKSFVNRYLLPFKNQATKVILFCALGILLLYIDSMYKPMVILKIIGIALILIGLSTHRMGLTHSITGMTIFTVIIAVFGVAYKFNYMEVYFGAAYASHLISDMMTKMGVPLFYPFSNKKIKFPLNFSTSSRVGKFIESAIIVLCIGFCTYVLFKYYI